MNTEINTDFDELFQRIMEEQSSKEQQRNTPIDEEYDDQQRSADPNLKRMVRHKKIKRGGHQ